MVILYHHIIYYTRVKIGIKRGGVMESLEKIKYKDKEDLTKIAESAPLQGGVVFPLNDELELLAISGDVSINHNIKHIETPGLVLVYNQGIPELPKYFWMRNVQHHMNLPMIKSPYDEEIIWESYRDMLEMSDKGGYRE
jgi:hypothetical protein